MIEAIVLCGGSGSRVQEITDNALAKILIPIQGEPFISHVIDCLLMQGIRSIVFAAGIHGKQIVDYVETKLSLPQKRYGFFQVIVEDKPLGTGGAVKCALDNSTILSQKPGEYIYVLNGDCIIIKPSHRDFPLCNYVMDEPYGSNYIWGSKLLNDGSFGSIEVGNKILSWFGAPDMYRINSFTEKVGSAHFINNGQYHLSKSLFDDVPEVCSLEYDLLPTWVKQHPFYLVEMHPNDKIDIGTTERIRNLRV